jgi:carboxymethylenebutenolidase
MTSLAPDLRIPVELWFRPGKGRRATLRARLAQAAPTNPSAAASRIEVVPGTEHGFHADYRRQYNAPAATAGWAKLLDWFRAAGV